MLIYLRKNNFHCKNSRANYRINLLVNQIIKKHAADSFLYLNQ